MSQILKKTTGLTGLAVCDNPRHELSMLYSKIMAILVRLPQESAYRKHTESLIKERNSIVQQNNDVVAIENKIGCGQVEELIEQAKNELSLVRKMPTWRPWESLIEEAPSHQWTWPPHK